MQKRIKNLFKDNLFLIAIFITLFIAYLSLIKMPTKSMPSFQGLDKVYHFFAYFTLAICWLFNFYKKNSLKYAIVISCIIYGIIIELLQGTLTDSRTADYKDVLANTLGILFALVIFNLIFKKINVN
ncbi:MAG: VanZ family protein [Polaribacter sp.]